MDTPIDNIRSGKLKLHTLEQEMKPKDAVSLRRTYIEETTHSTLHSIGAYTIAEDYAVTHNIENMIGCIQIPVGVAGLLAVNGVKAKGAYYIPLATTEGALVASINRGCRAITEAGGADVRIFSDGMTRAPVFAARDIPHAADAAAWIEQHAAELKKAAESTTSHGKLIGVSVFTAGTSVYVRMKFDTGLSMGMNMATIAAEAASSIIVNKTGLRLVASSGNLCCDKKPAAVNLIEGRGKTVSAGVLLNADVLKSLSQFNYDLAVLVPAQSGLDCDRKFHGLYDPAGDFDHFVRFAHHSAAGTTPCYLVDRTSEVDVDDIRIGFFSPDGRLDYGVRDMPVNLDADRPLVVVDAHFCYGLRGIADQSVGGDEFGVHHIGPELLAYISEGDVRHILHRCEEERAVSQI